jgi:phosphoenolpyruvate carboxylase
MHVVTAGAGAVRTLTTVIERCHLDLEALVISPYASGLATLVDDVEMVLAKTELDIFERYSRLAGEAAHAACFARVSEEFERTRSAVLAIKGADELLASDRRLRLSIRLRNPYVDPISLLQVDLLRRWRAAGRPADGLFHALVATVNGIAAGVQNTG